MPKIVNMEGLKFGMLSVVNRAGVNSDGRVTWHCQCDCGNEKVVSGKAMRGGETSSCGCLRWGDKRKADDMKITKADIEAVVTYNPETGALIWKERTAEQFEDKNLRRAWNDQWAGGKAGHFEADEGHVRLKIKNRQIYARRAIYILMTGRNPPGPLILKDGDKGNLKWANIAVKETKKSLAEKRAARLAARKPKPVYPGVVYDWYDKKWLAVINLAKFVTIRVGVFATDSEAIKARADKLESMGLASC